MQDEEQIMDYNSDTELCCACRPKDSSAYNLDLLHFVTVIVVVEIMAVQRTKQPFMKAQQPPEGTRGPVPQHFEHCDHQWMSWLVPNERT